MRIRCLRGSRRSIQENRMMEKDLFFDFDEELSEESQNIEECADSDDDQ